MADSKAQENGDKADSASSATSASSSSENAAGSPPSSPSSAPVAKSAPLRKPVFDKVSNLDPNVHGVNLVLKVVSVKSRVERRNKALTPGDKVGEAVVGDSSGVVTMSLRKEQVDKCQVGKTVVVRNAVVKMSKQHMRLEVNRWGKIELADEEATFTVNTKNDMSGVEYELVSVME